MISRDGRRLPPRVAQLARFASVGGVAFVVDIGLYNLMLFGPGQVLGDKPATAKIAAALVATLVSWVGNRWWTFGATRTATPARELLAFAAVNGVGIAVSTAVVWVGAHGLDLTSRLEINLTAFAGIALGTVVRYAGYRWLVFTGVRDDAGGAPPRPAIPAEAPDQDREGSAPR